MQEIILIKSKKQNIRLQRPLFKKFGRFFYVYLGYKKNYTRKIGV